MGLSDVISDLMMRFGLMDPIEARALELGDDLDDLDDFEAEAMRPYSPRGPEHLRVSESERLEEEREELQHELDGLRAKNRETVLARAKETADRFALDALRARKIVPAEREALAKVAARLAAYDLELEEDSLELLRSQVMSRPSHNLTTELVSANRAMHAAIPKDEDEEAGDLEQLRASARGAMGR